MQLELTLSTERCKEKKENTEQEIMFLNHLTATLSEYMGIIDTSQSHGSVDGCLWLLPGRVTM